MNIIITGGASGIGLALTRHFASQPLSPPPSSSTSEVSHQQQRRHQILILDINSDLGTSLAASLTAEFHETCEKVEFRKCHVSSWEEQAACFKEITSGLFEGRLDLVVANAGIGRGPEEGRVVEDYMNLEEQKEEEKEEKGPEKPGLRVLEVNLLGVIYSVKLATYYMNRNPPPSPSPADSKTRRGSIICTASNTGLYPFPISPLYAASKVGVIALVRSAARVLARGGIQINALAPATLETNIAPSKELFKSMTVTPMQVLLRGVGMFLADPSLTGQVAEIHGDGGDTSKGVTIRPPHEFVDEASERNIEAFWGLAYA